MQIGPAAGPYGEALLPGFVVISTLRGAIVPAMTQSVTIPRQARAIRRNTPATSPKMRDDTVVALSEA